MRPIFPRALFLACALAFSSDGLAAACGNDASGFQTWLAAFKQEAASAGISERTINSALTNVSYDPRTISLDRNQKVFKQSFEQFSARMVNSSRINRAKAMMQRHAALLARIEKTYGVQPPVVLAIWALETDFGANIGSFNTFRSLATLAYDCRRTARFHDELLSALKIVDRGDMTPSAMRGAWAGELGQTQFMASSYLKYAADGDGDGRRDLLRSVPDVLASTASYLKGYGWQAGADWSPGAANFSVIQQWNKSQVYAKTIALLATRIAGR